MDLVDELKRLTEKFDNTGIDYALCGGLAVAVYAKPRATLDIDMMIEGENISQAVAAAREVGFGISGPPMQLHGGAVIIHRLAKVDKETGEHLVLDLLVVTPQTRKAWDNRATVEWDGGPLKVLSPAGLILLKSFRNSGQDRDDIEYLRSLENED
ncbi:MAG TPA: hypothetical protein PK573_14925 [Spirochaetota bacterium]|nr:hypothetical protein [Spirochaetota bacterium]HSA15295.1 hypothetical protein [Spirochaetota bacterium]